MARNMLIALALVLLVVSVGNAATQGYAGGGPRVGFSMANWSGSDADRMADNLGIILEMAGFDGCSFSKGRRLGFSVGGFVRYDINERFAVQPEGAYALKGVKYSGGCYVEGYRVDMDYVYKTNYFEFPMLGVVKFGAPDRARFELLFGPYLALKVSSTVNVKVSLMGQSEDEDVDYEGVNGMDFGFIWGAGITHPSGVVADVRYGMGLGGVHESSTAPEVKNSVIALTAGFVF